MSPLLKPGKKLGKPWWTKHFLFVGIIINTPEIREKEDISVFDTLLGTYQKPAVHQQYCHGAVFRCRKCKHQIVITGFEEMLCPEGCVPRYGMQPRP